MKPMKLLLRIQPLLKESSQSPVAQAFGARVEAEQLLTLSERIERRSSGLVVDLVYTCLIILLFLFPAGICGLPLVVLGLALYSRIIRPLQRHRPGYIPPTVRECFGDRRTFEDPARDLWLAGVTGRDVAEALYTEQWIRRFRSVVRIGMIFWVAMVVSVVRAAWPMNFASVVWVFVAAALCLSVGFLVIALIGEDSIHRTIGARIRLWNKDREIPRRMEDKFQTISIGLFLGLIILGLCIAMPFLLGPVIPDGPQHLPPEQIGFFTHTLPRKYMLLVISMSLPLIPSALALAYYVLRKHTKRYHETMEKANHAFDRYMYETLMNDPDWARRE